ncbi:DNA polymerase IV [Leuconostoc litchii]|uniref:DNA polymerase IV n=1 Tax=Leuconostoc litchii TaxID=1981069 RepID=A0A652NDM6_9LACO|nr:DNA polymerase IV [Leuconostoc litchii]TYC45983.1 DNA polymerase IV [Leuconostoc litchii]GMA70315.1 DNA polymerase IV [Leuconostoc litchii]
MAEFLITSDNRKILHIDLDAFYAQIEIRDNPKLRHVPLIISRDPSESNGRGVVATANYAARQLGVHSAMSAAEAKQLAPNGVFMKPNFQKYQMISNQIHQIFHQYTNKIEPVAFDEAYLDLTESVLSGATLAAKLRHQILKEIHLTSSVGISYNKLLAKLASEFNKPNGVTVITEDNVLEFLSILPIASFRGVGKKTQEKFKVLGITNGEQLRRMSQEALRAQFGKMGEHLYWQARGVHFGEVKWQRQRQSVGKEETFDRFLQTTQEINLEFEKLVTKVILAMSKRSFVGRTLNIKIRDSEFNTITRSVTQNEPFKLDKHILISIAQSIFDENIDAPFSIRLLGLSFSNLQSSGFEEITLF